MENEQIQVQEEKIITGKTVLSFKSPTPMWATWTFRIVYWAVFGFSIWVTSTQLIPQASKAEIMLAAMCVDKVIWGLAKSIGIKKEDFHS